MNRYNATNRVSIIGIIGNIFLLVIKGIVGFLSNSQSMIADFFNSFGDIFSSLMTFIGNKISSKEADEDHNLGHGKAEYIYFFLISIIMILTAFSVIKRSIQTYINQETIKFSYILVIVSVTTIITKLGLYLYTKNVYKKYNNILIEANSKDHRNDCFITSLTLLSAIIGIYGYRIVDIIVGIIIGIWIFYTGIKIFKDSYDVLMDKAMDEETREKVYELIKKHDEILKVNHFNATPVGYRYQISFTIFVDGSMTTFESHEIANQLEREIEKEMPEIYLTVIHVNPMKIDK
jgi:cation diffusion facilitator family transporter